MTRIEPGKQVDALLPEKVAHGRVDVGVGARHPVAVLEQHAGKRSHRRPTGGDQMDMCIGAKGDHGRLSGCGDLCRNVVTSNEI